MRVFIVGVTGFLGLTYEDLTVGQTGSLKVFFVIVGSILSRGRAHYLYRQAISRY